MLKWFLPVAGAFAVYADIRLPVNSNPATATWFDAVAGFFFACAAFFTGRWFWKKR
jgi:hypothetical protein